MLQVVRPTVGSWNLGNINVNLEGSARKQKEVWSVGTANHIRILGSFFYDCTGKGLSGDSMFAEPSHSIQTSVFLD